MKLYLKKLLFLLSAASTSPLFADARYTTFCESMQPYTYNSGDTRDATTTVSIDNAPWIQLDLSGSELAAGATLTIVGDAATQVITSNDLSSNEFSAVFDGSSVSLELSSPGGIRGVTSRVEVSQVKVGLCKDDIISESICGDTDDRTPSTDVRMGRLSSGGGSCTAWLISEDAYVTAGHCGTPTSSSRIHFVFSNGSAPPEDQYAVDVSQYVGSGAFTSSGNDWGVGRVLPNSVTGKLPGVAQSEKCGTPGPGCGWFNLGSVPSTTTEKNIRITGYGSAATDSLSQRTHVGALTFIGPTYLQYVPDTTGGNSGSPVVLEETGLAIGVHTNGGCTASGGANLGTRIDKPDFKEAVDFVLEDCTQDSDCDDGVFCNGAETCTAGKCRRDDTEICDDGLACTINICNEAASMCEYQDKSCSAPWQSGLCIEPTGECEFNPCPDSLTRIEVDIITDNYPTETTWTVTDKCGSNEVVLSGGGNSYANSPNSPFSQNICAAEGEYEFTINDTYGDGICCSVGSGSYAVKYGGVEVASGGQFSSTETKSFGSTCPSPSDPTPPPTMPPTASPTAGNTPPPTSSPTNPPTTPPTNPPTAPPTVPPTNTPTASPTNPPTVPPTNIPTAPPTNIPTTPTTNSPTESPTNPPTAPSITPPTAPQTPAPTAPVTPTPTSGDADAVAQEAAFDSGYGAPRCANVGSSCDSLALLNGRGIITNGNEPNHSNTNKNGAVCNDGNSGTYQYDESIEQITVTAGDIISGTPVPSGDFIVEGGRAFVTVDLWCWNTGSSDTADIYITSDASSPDWQPLASINCPGGGAQTITHAFDVPSGANQSIRVNLRYNGSPSTCSNGNYDDHDDLIFTVKADTNATPPPTPAPTPPLTPVPTNDGSSSSGPQTASYDTDLGAPKCSYGVSCDSGAALLNGRGSIANGNEFHAPNTLDACIDGNSGTYHSDESIDRIVVTKASGTVSGSDMTEGDEVTVSVNVWCWNTGSSDYIDFYYASDATLPVWTQIGDRQPCPGGGAQTVTASFTLPQGSLQAVRANMMYGSVSTGLNSCTSGNYDDTDDLVISVKPNPAMQGVSEAAFPIPSRHDDEQGEIIEAWKDIEADEMKKDLNEMNASTEKPKLKGQGKGKGKGGGKGKGKWKDGEKKGKAGKGKGKGSDDESESRVGLWQ